VKPGVELNRFAVEWGSTGRCSGTGPEDYVFL
jgi:hypothetical protein